MKLKLLSSLFLCMVIGISLFSIWNEENHGKLELPLFSNAPSSIEGKFQSRREYNLMRLADPETGKIPANIRHDELAFAASLPKDTDAGRSLATWSSRGPWNVGGRTRALAVDISNENVLLAGGVSGGLWRSDNGGQSWLRVTPAEEHPGVNAIAQDTRVGKTNNWYYLSGEGYGTSASETGAFYLGQGAYKSTDGGITWTKLTSTALGSPHSFSSNWQVTWNVVTDPSDLVNDVVYVATYGALYRSIDGGENWVLALGGSGTDSYFVDVAVTSTGVVYAVLSSEGSNKGVWRSMDGVNFIDITPSSFPAEYERIVMGINPSDENEVYFLAVTPNSGKMTPNYLGDPEHNSLWKYTYLSGDGSGSNGAWEDRSQNLPSDGSQFGNFNSQGGYDLLVRVKPDDPNTVFIGGTNLFRSTSAFSDSLNTVQIGGYGVGAVMPFYSLYPNQHPDQHALSFSPANPDVMFSGHDGGISKTTDNMASGVSWESLNNGYLTSQFYTAAIDNAAINDSMIVGGLQDNGTHITNSLNASNNWAMPSLGDGAFCAIADGKSSFYFSRQLGHTIKCTLDANGTPTAFTRIDPAGAKESDYLFINPFILDPNNNNIMYVAGGTKIWRNSDLSQLSLDNKYDSVSTNWTYLPDTITFVNTQVTALAASKSPANVLYYGTSKKRLYRVDNAHSSNPVTKEISYASFPSSGNISCVAVDPHDANKVMIVFSNYKVYSVFYTNDGGTTWHKVAGNLEQNSTGSGSGPSCRWASILYVSNQPVYFLGTSTGLYATSHLDEQNTTWIQQGANTIGNAVVDMVLTRESDGLVVAATHGNGIFTSNIKALDEIGTAISNSKFDIPNLILYPNPSNAYLNFEFYSESTYGAIDIYDYNGRRIKHLELENLTFGKNMLTVNIQEFSAGVYYYKLNTGKVESGKFVISR